jgi:hypothetical protein
MIIAREKKRWHAEEIGSVLSPITFPRNSWNLPFRDLLGTFLPSPSHA